MSSIATYKAGKILNIPGINDFTKVLFYLRKNNINWRYFNYFKEITTLNDEIINTKKGNGRAKLKGDTFLTYKEMVKVLNSYEYQNKIINRETAKQKFVDFILGLVVSNYKIN